MGKSIQTMGGAGPKTERPLLIGWMSFQLAIPRRGALQQSSLPLHQPRNSMRKFLEEVEIGASAASAVDDAGLHWAQNS